MSEFYADFSDWLEDQMDLDADIMYGDYVVWDRHIVDGAVHETIRTFSGLEAVRILNIGKK